MPYAVLITHASRDYELLDSGAGEKLERYGAVTVARPDPQALWHKGMPERWKDTDATFVRSGTPDTGKQGKWRVKPGIPARWQIELGGLTFWIKPTAFKHTGLFPEQSANWAWIAQRIQGAKRPVSMLNLFGYTGGATLAALSAGAMVTHVDGSKAAVTWARENAALSGLAERPVRWILDDARVFLRRELKRGTRYDAVVLDPPAFGRGPTGQLWKIETHFPDLMELVRGVLSDAPLFVLVNGYASGYSALAYANILGDLRALYGGAVEGGELALEESGAGGGTARLLSAGIFARWGV